MFLPFKNIEALLGGLIGFFIILLFTHHSGIGLSRDSIAYISAANSFVEGKGFIEYDHTALTLFPIGYPVILGIIKFITHNQIIVIGTYINSLLYATFVYLLGCIIKKQVYPNRILAITLMGLLVFAIPLHEDFFMLWSESIFILLQLFLIIILTQYFNKPQNKYYYLIIFITAYAALTRFAGITFIAVAALFLLVHSNLSIWKKWKNVLMGVMIAIAPLTINLIYNYYITAEPVGNRQNGLYSLYQNICFSGIVIGQWFYFPFLNNSVAFIVGIFILLLFLYYSIIILLRVYKHKSSISYYKIATVLGAVYYLFMLITATLSRFETINNRLLSPLFIPLLFLLIHIAQRFINSSLFGSQQIIKETIITAIFIIFLSKEVIISYSFYTETQEGGIGGYTEDSWRESETIRFVKEHINLFSKLSEHDIPVYSNSAHALYLYTNTYFNLLPEKTHLNKIASLYKQPSFYVIWFNEEGNDDMLPIGSIKKIRSLKVVEQFSDGTIYLADN